MFLIHQVYQIVTAAIKLPWSLTARALLSARSHLLPTLVHWDVLHLYNRIKVYWKSATYYVYLFLKCIADILHAFQALYNCQSSVIIQPDKNQENSPFLINANHCWGNEENWIPCITYSSFISDTYRCFSLTPTDVITQPSKLSKLFLSHEIVAEVVWINSPCSCPIGIYCLGVLGHIRPDREQLAQNRVCQYECRLIPLEIQLPTYLTSYTPPITVLNHTPKQPRTPVRKFYPQFYSAFSISLWIKETFALHNCTQISFHNLIVSEQNVQNPRY